jgi:hypothetical protein
MLRKITALLTLLSIGLLTLQSFKYFPQDDKWINCLVKYRFNWGESCNSCQMPKDTYKVYLRNTCDETLDVVVCVQETSKRWRYYSFKKLAPKDSVSAYACVGTGKILKFVKPSNNTELVLPTSDEVNAQYAK